MITLPGTTLAVDDISHGFGFISPIIKTTGGLTLAQLKSVSGIEASTIQNWIKRGWVAHPVNKTYGEIQTARVLIINSLRNSMKLDNIASLLKYVNGETECREDDSAPDQMIYTYLCRVIALAEKDGIKDRNSLDKPIETVLSDYTEPFTGAKEKLANTLGIMALACISARIIDEAQELYNNLGI